MSKAASPECSDKALSILQAAASVFLQHGFSAATTDMIQREAGVSKATLYACFPNKDAMFAAVIERQCATMAESVRTIAAVPGDIAKTLADMGDSYLRIVLSPDGLALFRVVVAEAPRFPHLGRQFYLAGPKVMASMVASQLAEAAQAGEIDVQSVGVEAAATLFVGMLRAEGQLECLTHPHARPSDAQLDYWVQLAVSTFLAAFGVATPKPTADAPRADQGPRPAP